MEGVERSAGWKTYPVKVGSQRYNLVWLALPTLLFVGQNWASRRFGLPKALHKLTAFVSIIGGIGINPKVGIPFRIEEGRAGREPKIEMSAEGLGAAARTMAEGLERWQPEPGKEYPGFVRIMESIKKGDSEGFEKKLEGLGQIEYQEVPHLQTKEQQKTALAVIDRAQALQHVVVKVKDQEFAQKVLNRLPPSVQQVVLDIRGVEVGSKWKLPQGVQVAWMVDEEQGPLEGDVYYSGYVRQPGEELDHRKAAVRLEEGVDYSKYAFKYAGNTYHISPTQEPVWFWSPQGEHEEHYVFSTLYRTERRAVPAFHVSLAPVSGGEAVAYAASLTGLRVASWSKDRGFPPEDFVTVVRNNPDLRDLLIDNWLFFFKHSKKSFGSKAFQKVADASGGQLRKLELKDGYNRKDAPKDVTLHGMIALVKKNPFLEDVWLEIHPNFPVESVQALLKALPKGVKSIFLRGKCGGLKVAAINEAIAHTGLQGTNEGGWFSAHKKELF